MLKHLKNVHLSPQGIIGIADFLHPANEFFPGSLVEDGFHGFQNHLKAKVSYKIRVR